MQDKGMTAYTKWWIKYPWHVSNMLVPDNCGCEYCTERRARDAKRRRQNSSRL